MASGNLVSPARIKALLEELEFQPSKVLGQNFLIDGNIRDMIIETASVQPGERVLEVGPGLGVLTEELVKKAGYLTSIEKDDRLFTYLKKTFAGQENLALVHGDAVKYDYGIDPFDRFVSNLPYSVGNRIVMDVVQLPKRPKSLTIMVQLDVAERMIAEPGNKQYGILSIIPQVFYEAKKVKTVSHGCFMPPPTIKSAVVHYSLREKPLVETEDWEGFVLFVKKVFGQRRKQMKSTLRLELNEFDLTRRPETFSAEELGQIFELVNR